MDAEALRLLVDRLHEADDFDELARLAEALVAHAGGRAALMDVLRATLRGEHAAAADWVEELRARGVREDMLHLATRADVAAHRCNAIMNVLTVDAGTRSLYVAALEARDVGVRRQAFFALEGGQLGVPELVVLLRAEARHGIWKSAADAIDLLAEREGGLRELVLSAEGRELPAVAILLARIIGRERSGPRAVAEARGLLRGLLRHEDGRARAAAAALLAALDGNDGGALTALRDALRGADVGARSTAVRFLAWHAHDPRERLLVDPDPAVRAGAAEAIRVGQTEFSMDELRLPAGRRDVTGGDP